MFFCKFTQRKCRHNRLFIYLFSNVFLLLSSRFCFFFLVFNAKQYRRRIKNQKLINNTKNLMRFPITANELEIVAFICIYSEKKIKLHRRIDRVTVIFVLGLLNCFHAIMILVRNRANTDRANFLFCSKSIN